MLWTLIIGLIVGFFAKLITPGHDPGGFFSTMLLGVAGSFIASIIGQVLGWYRPDQPAGFLMSVVGAVILLLIFRFVRGTPPGNKRL